MQPTNDRIEVTTSTPRRRKTVACRPNVPTNQRVFVPVRRGQNGFLRLCVTFSMGFSLVIRQMAHGRLHYGGRKQPLHSAVNQRGHAGIARRAAFHIPMNVIGRKPRKIGLQSSSLSSPSSLSTTLQSHLTLPSSNGEGPYRIRHVVAPMVAASDYAFRCLCRQYYGSEQHHEDETKTKYETPYQLLTFTQMLHSKHLVQKETFRRDHLDLYECLPIDKPGDYLDPDTWSSAQQNMMRGFTADSTAASLLHSKTKALQAQLQSQHQQDDVSVGCSMPTRGPLIVQLAGHDVSQVVDAAQVVYQNTQGRVHGVDLNLGCPQGIARKGRYGAFLMEQEEPTVYKILSGLRLALPDSVAVSCKIRLPPTAGENDDLVLRRRIRGLIDAGVDFLTIHGRTLHENKTRVGRCDWDRIRTAVNEANEYVAQKGNPQSFPIIANGGIEIFDDIERVQKETGAAAVMSSEALLERPNLFCHSGVTDPSASPIAARRLLQQQFQFAWDYLYWCSLFPPLPGVLGHVGGSFNVVRGHLFKILHRYLHENADMRERLASHEMTGLVDAMLFLNDLESRYVSLSDDELFLSRKSSQKDSSWYRRHWRASDRVHLRQRASEIITPSTTMSIEEKKALIKSRISRLRDQKVSKKGKMSISSD